MTGGGPAGPVARRVGGGLALILLGLTLYAIGYALAAWTGRQGDANIGAGLLGVLGIALGAIGALWLVIVALDVVYRHWRERG